MEQQPKEITQHITKPRGKVFITPAAETALADMLHEEQVQLPESDLYRTLGVSLNDFLDCDYMRRSAWFKAQKAHTFVGLNFLDPDTTEVRNNLRLVVEHNPGAKLIIQTPGEYTLPEDYYETRVIEETRVLYKQLIQ